MESDKIHEASSLFTFGDIKRRVKKNDAVKITKLNTSFASKIKTKIINNSSFYKTSLKHNNKALAIALSAEKENSRRLKSVNLLLLKEVNDLHLQNALLCQKLNCLKKTLIEIEAFLNNNLLTAIEISTISEYIPKPLKFVTLEGYQCNSFGHRSETSGHCIRSIERLESAPYITEHDGKKQNSISVCEADDLIKQIPVPSKETAADKINTELLVYEKMPESNEASKMETIFVSNTFSKENQSCVEQISSHTFMSDLDNVSSVEAIERHSKAHHIPLPFHGYVTERKKQGIFCISDAPSIINNFDTKIDPKNILNCGTGKVCTPNEIGNQLAPNSVSHTEASPQSSNKLAQINKDRFINDQQSEETLYDADMELTASELGEILIIKSKAKEKNANILKADKISANLRKVKYSNTEKQIKNKCNNKPKKSNEKVPSYRKVKNISSIKSKKNLPQKKELFQGTSQEMKLKGTSEHYVVEDSRNSNKDDRQMHPVDLKCQLQTTHILQTEKIKDINSETVDNSGKQAPEQGFNAPSSKVLLEGYCIESLPPLESVISDVMAMKKDFDVNEDAHPVVSKTNKSHYYEIGNGQYVRRNFKGIISHEYISDSQKKSGLKANRKSGYNNREVTCKCSTTERSSHALVVPKTVQMNEEFSHGDKRKCFAKASRKTYIIYPNSHNQKTSSVKQKLQDENIAHTDIHMTTENIQRIVDVQNVTPSCSVKEAESSAEIFQNKIDSKPCRKTYVVCSCDQDKSIDTVILENIETTIGFCKIPKNDPVLKNPQILPSNCQEKNDYVSKGKVNRICEESCNRTPVPDSGSKPLQELTNIRVQSLLKPKKDLEENYTPPIRRRRTTVCYKEPNIKSKLRRGEESTDKEFPYSTIFKVKNKQFFKSKSRLI